MQEIQFRRMINCETNRCETELSSKAFHTPGKCNIYKILERKLRQSAEKKQTSNFLESDPTSSANKKSRWKTFLLADRNCNMFWYFYVCGVPLKQTPQENKQFNAVKTYFEFKRAKTFPKERKWRINRIIRRRSNR